MFEPLQIRFVLTGVCMSLGGFLGGFALATPLNAAEHLFHHEHVLGTSLELRVHTSSQADAEKIEQLALREIDRLADILSRHDPTSELMRWQKGVVSDEKISAELLTVLDRAEDFRQLTGGAFDVRAAALGELWEAAETRGRRPTDSQRQAIVSQLTGAAYSIEPSGSVLRHDRLPLTLDALGKGFILDAVCELVQRQHPDIDDFTIKIDGDLRKLGRRPLEIAISDPRNATEGAQPQTSFTSDAPLAMATSGDYRRYVEIAGQRYSHIMDPRTGLPASEVISASVIAPNATDADALATSLSVLGPVHGLALVESLDDVECYLVLASGKVVVSSRWPTKQNESEKHFDNTQQLVMLQDGAKDQTGLLVTFTLSRPEGGRYRRPYVAVWLEDKDGFPVKTAVLWLQTNQPGPRWHRDLTRWYRNDRMRGVVEETELIGTVSGATRGPGEYEARFDGTDNAGKPLPNGKYSLCIEVAREHGTYQLIRESMDLQGTPIETRKLEGNVEVGSASFRYIPPKAEPLAAIQ